MRERQKAEDGELGRGLKGALRVSYEESKNIIRETIRPKIDTRPLGKTKTSIQSPANMSLESTPETNPLIADEAQRIWNNPILREIHVRHLNESLIMLEDEAEFLIELTNAKETMIGQQLRVMADIRLHDKIVMSLPPDMRLAAGGIAPIAGLPNAQSKAAYLAQRVQFLSILVRSLIGEETGGASESTKPPMVAENPPSNAIGITRLRNWLWFGGLWCMVPALTDVSEGIEWFLWWDRKMDLTKWGVVILAICSAIELWKHGLRYWLIPLILLVAAVNPKRPLLEWDYGDDWIPYLVSGLVFLGYACVTAKIIVKNEK